MTAIIQMSTKCPGGSVRPLPPDLAEPDTAGIACRSQRLWEYDLAHCEKGILSPNIDVRQMMLPRPP